MQMMQTMTMIMKKTTIMVITRRMGVKEVPHHHLDHHLVDHRLEGGDDHALRLHLDH